MGLFYGTIDSVVKSLISKICEQHEQGKIQSLAIMVTSLANLGVESGYNLVYQKTLDSSVPGTVFLMSAGLTMIIQIFFGLGSY